MVQRDTRFYIARAEEAELLAATSFHRGAKAAHERMAASYRAYAAIESSEVMAFAQLFEKGDRA